MPLNSLVKSSAFEPELVAAMGRAFEETLVALRLADRDDPATLLVAKKIIELAQNGEHDPDRLRDRSIRELTKTVEHPDDKEVPGLSVGDVA